MIALAIALILSADPPAAISTGSPDATIIITGTRLADYRAAVDACIAVRCAPKRDIVASIRYAEALFRTGDVRGAREVLAKSVRRNEGAGAVEPAALSQLYLAQANVALTFGEQRDVVRAMNDSAIVARENLPPGSPDVLWAELRVADLRGTTAFVLDETPYIAIASRARAAGQTSIAVAADLHRAAALSARGHKSAALRLLAAIEAMPGDEAQPYRLAARVITARIARAGDDKTATGRLLTGSPSELKSAVPVLVWAPPLPAPTDAVFHDPIAVTADSQTRSSDSLGLQWVDIGFAIRDDGGVDTPEILHGSRMHDWAAPLLTAIAARRYTPSPGQGDFAGRYRVERFTLTADFATPAGSLIRRRAGAPRYQQIDLTEDAPKR